MAAPLAPEAASASSVNGAAHPNTSAAGGTGGSCASRPGRLGAARHGIGGIQWAARRGSGPCPTAAATGGGTLPSNPYDGDPPLIFGGGDVVGGTTPGALTVVPVYWAPSSGGWSIPSTYESLINQFITDAAAADGRKTNVFSAVTEYTDAAKKHLGYKLTAGTPITDTDPFPANGCTPDSGAIWSDGTGYSACITDSQLQSEAVAFTNAHGLPNSDLAHLYVFFMPKGAETCWTSSDGAQGGTCSINAAGGLCGYHSYAGNPLYASMTYAVVDSPTGWTCSSDAGSNTFANETPNGNIDADSEISILSHEISETVTDPQGTAWLDAAGNEIGDDCSYIYGDSRSWGGKAGAKWDQTINGHHYFVQEEFSNQDFRRNRQYSCIQEEATVASSPRTGPAGTSVTLRGSGYASAETVTVTYATGLSSPATVTICSATSTARGTFSCSGTIPATAGATGKHAVSALGATSKHRAMVKFALT